MNSRSDLLSLESTPNLILVLDLNCTVPDIKLYYQLLLGEQCPPADREEGDCCEQGESVITTSSGLSEMTGALKSPKCGRAVDGPTYLLWLLIPHRIGFRQRI